MTVSVGGQQILTSKTIKYLGLQIDPKLKFTQHAKDTAIKAQKVVNNISRILPNISLATPRKRRLIASAVQSILLYGAPNWADRMSAKGKTELTKVQRKAAIRVVSAYSTISAVASQVLADLPPIDLLAIEKTNLHGEMDKRCDRPQGKSKRNPDEGLAGKMGFIQRWQMDV